MKKSLEVDVVIGADGANSRVAKDIEAGDYEYAIAFQAMEGHPMAPQRVERIRIMFLGVVDIGGNGEMVSDINLN